ncbi:hydroxylamine reductase [candidate division WOR-3 bacterium]|uniref:Hydroxylamine reductase n=1 Tax=candidate division WOR-3 bacterium TaxID=2052148 RepID=A0A937XEF1_UNCW3|nr:hydroxylamine reductase [candidate division WOR-3 bacterium]
MFCYQCEQTARGTGCTAHGVCGKDETCSTLQDLLVYATKGVSQYAHRARALGAVDREVNVFTVEALFTTITNVDFDTERLSGWLEQAFEMRNKARTMYEEACRKSGKTPEQLSGPAAWQPPVIGSEIFAQGHEQGVLARHKLWGDDLADLHDLALYGLKGAAAYADHAQKLGQEDDAAYAEFHRILDLLARDQLDADTLFAAALDAGRLNYRTMELLDAANTGAFGHPAPTPVRMTPVKGKAILVSGHSLRDLAALLKQTEGKGINVYTHGEMLPAHGYPNLRKYGHLVGHYGTAWQNQQKEFADFPGAILMTTNCIQKPRDEYFGRIFTSGLVAWPGVAHIPNQDFSPVIKAALEAPGFTADEPEKTTLVGFARNAVLAAAPKVIELVKAGKIKHFFLVGGCDGSKPERNYYTELVEKTPKDTIVLTLACGKFKFNHLQLGDIEGIPRLLDIGQCNDAYSAIQIALALAQAFNTEVNKLPLSIILSWYEQKAVAILLTLLALDVKNIRIGPSLPAFLTPNLVKILVDKYQLAPTKTADEDLKAILG